MTPISVLDLTPIKQGGGVASAFRCAVSPGVTFGRPASAYLQKGGGIRQS